ncbi:MAG: hypothetical protein BA866_04225 [Desulfobulbaceae bacterium S5133MH15]|nr:MAG: hypothetical protein BA866_04225 [Desulfobulbaceae bacterium S5133MH15]
MKISVIIPVYNAAKYVRKATESALQQPETAEILLIEDNSPDHSLQVCRDLEEEYERVRLLRHPDGRNHGAGATRNLGIRAAKCDYIAFLDADDFYLPGRHSVPKALFEQHPDTDGVYEAIGVQFYDEQTKQDWLHRGHGELTTMTERVNPNVLFEALVRDGKGMFHLDGLTVKRDIFKRCGYFYEHLKLHQDTAMLIRMSECAVLIPGRLDTPVAMRGIHGENRILNECSWETRCAARKTLFYWGLRRKLSVRRLIALFHNYVLSLYSTTREHKNFAAYERTWLKRLICACATHPILFIGATLQFVSKMRFSINKAG